MSFQKEPVICIIGLGLIGGSMAYALRGFHGAHIIGVDVNRASVGAALKAGAIDEAFDSPAEAVRGADLVILCVYPHHIHDIVIENAPYFKPGAIVCDVCGTKEHLYGGMHQYIPETIDYVGIHPMAGKEVDGFFNAEPGLFKDTGFIIVPLPETKPGTVQNMQELAGYIGATRLAVSTPHQHDAVIAYTSDLMHISATALCVHYHPDMNSAYTAGAFRDCTRIANINPDLWTELFFANRTALLPRLEQYIDDLQAMRAAIQTQDKETMRALLKTAAENKHEMLKRQAFFETNGRGNGL